MKTFLHQVVLNILRLNVDLDRIVVVLPTQRAGVYLKKYLLQELTHVSFLPKIITFDNLVETINDQKKTDSIELLFDFYEIHKSLTPKEKLEPIESFISWAKKVLDDFNEIDNNLIKPEHIFNTLKRIQDIHHLFSESENKNSYLDFINQIDTYYFKFNEFLINNNKNYQGMLYKNVINDLEHFTKHTEFFYVFAGFAHLKKAEELIIEALISAKKAKIFWDISYTFYNDTFNQNSFFHRYFNQWNAYKTQPFSNFYSSKLDTNALKVIGVSKKVGMVKYLAHLLQNEENIEEVTVLLNDQNLVNALLQSLPTNVEKVNITMGVPLQHFPITDLILSILDLHIDSANHNKGFYFKNVLKILQNQMLAKDNFKIQPVIEILNTTNLVFFLVTDIKKAFQNHTNEVNSQLLKLFKNYSNDSYITLLETINEFILILKSKENAVENEIMFNHYSIIQALIHLLKRYTITNLKSIRMVLQKLMQSEHLNFYGEPLQGLQLMGFLESQVLDFNKVYILSVNENILPKNKLSESFIPFDVRNHYALPTYKDREMLDKYLFYRILDKSKQVVILYNSDIDSFGKGEKSRFIEQLLWRYPQINHTLVEPTIKFSDNEVKIISKTDESIAIIQKILQNGISPSALALYIYNPIEFYKQKVLNLKEITRIEETVAEKTLGTVVHAVLEHIYTPFIEKFIDVSILREIAINIRLLTTEAFLKEFKNPHINEGKNKLIFEVAVNFINRFIENEIKDIEAGNNIKILGLEQKISSDFQFDSFEFPIKFKGIIDRIDEYNGKLRIIDYKTGTVIPTQLKTNQFAEKIRDYKYSKALQVMLYACMYSRKNDVNNKILTAGIISFKKHKNGFMPLNFGEKRGETDYEITLERQDSFMYEIELLLNEILNKDTPFKENEV